MTTNNNYSELGIFSPVLKFMDQHRTLTNIILAIEALALFLAVWTYDFTTRI